MRKATVFAAAVGLFVLFAGLTTNIFSTTQCTYAGRAAIQLKMIGMSVENFAIDTGQLPQDLEQLLDSDLSGWDGPYLRIQNLDDPWGNRYIYRISTKNASKFVVAFIPPEGRNDGRTETLYAQAMGCLLIQDERRPGCMPKTGVPAND